MRGSDSAARSPASRNTIVLICDLDGRVTASSNASSPLLSGLEGSEVTSTQGQGPTPEGDAARHFAEVFGSNSHLSRWLAEQYVEARDIFDYQAESELVHDGKPLYVRLEALSQDGHPYGFALHVSDCPRSLLEGETIVTRQQWHDIKNHLGGVKLYATFLKRKLAGGEDLPIVEKILNGINGLIEELARIRRGE